MKKAVLIVTLAASALLLSGCDFFRTLAGRPTSADIEVKREALAQAAAQKERARQDSLAAVQAARKAVEDSLAVMAELSGTTRFAKLKRNFDAATTASIDHRYYVFTGAFGESSNADKCASKLEAAGFKAVKLKYQGGMTAVAVNPADRIVEAYETLKRVTELDFVPKDSFIMDVAAL